MIVRLVQSYRPTNISGSDSRQVKAVNRACAILSYLAECEVPQSISAIGDAMGIHRSTAFRLVKSLEAGRLITREPLTGRYELGLGLVAMSGFVLGRLEILRIADPHLRWLADETRETVSLAVLWENRALTIEQIPGANVLRSLDWLGQLTPLHRGSASKALLAHLRVDERDAYLANLKSLDREIDLEDLTEQLDAIRERGYAVNREEVLPREFAVGAPIFNSSGQVCASVSAAVYREAIAEAYIQQLAAGVVETANSVSRQLGYGSRARSLA